MHDYKLRESLDSYAGNWVAICNRHIVASGINEKKVSEEGRINCPIEWLLVAKVP